KNPSAYHPRTLMPNLMLDVIVSPEGKKTDPAADIATYLLKSGADWKPESVPPRLSGQVSLTKEELESLDALALESLRNAVPNLRVAKDYLQNGIDEKQRGDFKGDEVELVGRMTDQKKLLYVGRRAISKYGCSGCHDIPGFEDAKSIGTSLADWGRKDPSRLAFEQIGEYINTYAWPKKEGTGSDKSADAPDDAKAGGSAAKSLADIHAPLGTTARPAQPGTDPEHLDYALDELGPTQGWLMDKLLGHEREGFLWQKLHSPRSYDFKKTENKGYNDRLRMPQFN